MSLPKSVTMTRDGGFYWRAMVFRYAVTYIILLPVLAVILVTLINPFWFRDSMFRWVETKVNQIARWRNYQQYRFYLGTDPEMWHTLKGDSQHSESSEAQASP